MKKLFTFLLALCTSITLWAGNVITYTADAKLTETTSTYSDGFHTTAFNVSISGHTFADGTGTITFAGDVTSIGEYAFNNCSGLTSITIPNSVTSIGWDAFYGCSGLTSITIPEGVTSIGSYAFFSCTGLTSITIPEGVTSIGNSAFYGCTSLTSVAIPEGVASIGRSMFWGCTALTSVTIPSSVTSIDHMAFSGCSALTSITIPSSVISIESDAFYNVPLINYNGPATGSPWGATVVNGVLDGVLIFEDSTKTTIKDCSTSAQGDLTIPEGVTSIGEYAFLSCSGLTSITIPNSVTSIGRDAFFSCTGLTSITIPESVTSIGEFAFSGCTSLTSVVWNAVNCASPIGDAASPFYRIRTNITNFTFGEEVQSIPDFLCYGMTGLTSVTIPESVTGIGSYAFCDCSGLTSVTIPESVTNIGWSVFDNCSGLTKIICEAILPPVCNGDCFDNVDKSIPLYVPTGSVAAYQAAEGWQDFTNILPIPSPIGNIAVVSADETMGAAYGSGSYDNGTEVTLYAIPADGYKFTAWNDGVTANPRTVLVAGDSTFTASFAPEVTEATYDVNVSSVNPAWGSASAQEAVVLTAVPEAGYKFLMWSDGNTENPRAIILTDDINLMAIFTPDAATEVSAATAPEGDLRKELIQGKVYITRDGSTYTILGTRVK